MSALTVVLTAGTVNAEILSYEWEEGTISGGATTEYGGGLSGGAGVGWLHLDGASAKLEQIDGGQGGRKSLILYYGMMTDASVQKMIKVNGTEIILDVKPTSAWIGDPQPLAFEAEMTPGLTNTIELTTGFPYWGGILLDRITVDLGTDAPSVSVLKGKDRIATRKSKASGSLSQRGGKSLSGPVFQAPGVFGPTVFDGRGRGMRNIRLP